MRQPRWRWWISGGAFALGSIVNPGWVAGCKLGGAHAIEEELVDKLTELNHVGRWTFSDDDQVSYDISLRLAQRRGRDQVASAPWPARLFAQVHACDTHTFFQGASACLDSYELAVEGVMNLHQRGSADPIVSDVQVMGILSKSGVLQLTFGAAKTNELKMIGRDDDFAVESFSGADLGDGNYTIQKR